MSFLLVRDGDKQRVVSLECLVEAIVEALPADVGLSVVQAALAKQAQTPTRSLALRRIVTPDAGQNGPQAS